VHPITTTGVNSNKQAAYNEGDEEDEEEEEEEEEE